MVVNERSIICSKHGGKASETTRLRAELWRAGRTTDYRTTDSGPHLQKETKNAKERSDGVDEQDGSDAFRELGGEGMSQQ